MSKTVGLVALFLMLGLLLAPGLAGAQATITIKPKESGCPPPATFCWDPATLTGVGGQAVTVALNNTGQAPHSFCIALTDGEHCTPNAQSGTAAAGQSEVTFTLPAQGGNFRYVCKVPGHDTLGMTGNLTVTPSMPGGDNMSGGNQSTGGSTPPPKSSPTVGIVAIVAGIALLAIAVRRR